MSENAPTQLVPGVVCPNGHFGHDESRYCMVCGSARAPLAGPEVVGPRPPLGVLILADGSTRVLDSDLTVIEPESSGGLGFLRPGEDAIEPPVAEIRLVGWQPVVSCAVWPIVVTLPGGGRLRVGPDVPVPLVPGAQFEFGEHVIRYESPHQEAELHADAAATRDHTTTPMPPMPRGGDGRMIKSASVRTKRMAAVAAAVVTLAAAVTIGLVSDRTDSTGDTRRVVAERAPVPVPTRVRQPGTMLPSRGTTPPTQGMEPIALPANPRSTQSHPHVPAPVQSPPPSPTTTSVPAPTPDPPAPSPVPAPPTTTVPPTQSCTVNLMAILQCVVGGSGG